MKFKIAKYKDLINIPICENGEDFVVANFYDKSIKFRYLRLSEMKKYFGGKMIVRKKVAKKLSVANKLLKNKYPNFTLFIFDSYRKFEIQRKYFKKEYKKLKEANNNLEENDLLEMVHVKIAVPEVSGHPTGGAIDVTIYDSDKKAFLDMGSAVDDFDDPRMYTFTKKINNKQRKNRKILRDILTKQNFCPFFGEWWHFSYGDKEWAYFYCKIKAIYKQKKIKEIILKN